MNSTMFKKVLSILKRGMKLAHFHNQSGNDTNNSLGLIQNQRITE